MRSRLRILDDLENDISDTLQASRTFSTIGRWDTRTAISAQQSLMRSLQSMKKNHTLLKRTAELEIFNVYAQRMGLDPVFDVSEKDKIDRSMMKSAAAKYWARPSTQERAKQLSQTQGVPLSSLIPVLKPISGVWGDGSGYECEDMVIKGAQHSRRPSVGSPLTDISDGEEATFRPPSARASQTSLALPLSPRTSVDVLSIMEAAPLPPSSSTRRSSSGQQNRARRRGHVRAQSVNSALSADKLPRAIFPGVPSDTVRIGTRSAPRYQSIDSVLSDDMSDLQITERRGVTGQSDFPPIEVLEQLQRDVGATKLAAQIYLSMASWSSGQEYPMYTRYVGSLPQLTSDYNSLMSMVTRGAYLLPEAARGDPAANTSAIATESTESLPGTALVRTSTAGSSRSKIDRRPSTGTLLDDVSELADTESVAATDVSEAATTASSATEQSGIRTSSIRPRRPSGPSKRAVLRAQAAQASQVSLAQESTKQSHHGRSQSLGTGLDNMPWATSFWPAGASGRHGERATAETPQEIGPKNEASAFLDDSSKFVSDPEEM